MLYSRDWDALQGVLSLLWRLHCFLPAAIRAQWGDVDAVGGSGGTYRWLPHLFIGVSSSVTIANFYWAGTWFLGALGTRCDCIAGFSSTFDKTYQRKIAGLKNTAALHKLAELLRREQFANEESAQRQHQARRNEAHSAHPRLRVCLKH